MGCVERVVGRRPGFLLILSPPSFPEHFSELVGFEALHLLQRDESSGWHNAEVIILGRSFALLPTVARQRWPLRTPASGSQGCFLPGTGRVVIGMGTLIM